MKVGIALITGFGANLIFTLFVPLSPGESIAGLISGIIFSSLMIIWGVYRIRRHITKKDRPEYEKKQAVEGRAQ